MKILVLGCNGMAGHVISLYMNENGHEVIGFSRKKSKFVKTIVGDARNDQILREIITGEKFDAVINCIGILNKQAEQNRPLTVSINTYLPHFLAELTHNTRTQIIHMSTDCVFSGKRGSYTEDDIPDGEMFYDRSKALGELYDDKNLTLRNSIVGPDINENGNGLLNWFMRQKGEIKGYTKVLWTGQTTLQLAKTMERAIAERAHGLFNAVPDHPISKYELLWLFNRYLRNNDINISPDDTIVSDRSLVRTRFGFSYIIPSYEDMTAQLAEWLQAHKNIYSQYNF